MPPRREHRTMADVETIRWSLDDRDTGCPETLANHLLRLADQVLGEAA